MGHLGDILGPSWPFFWPSWGHLEGLRVFENGDFAREVLKKWLLPSSWGELGHFRASSAIRGSSWAILGGILGHVGVHLGRSWGALGPSLVILWPYWLILWPSWLILGAILFLLGAILDHLGVLCASLVAILGHLSAVFESFLDFGITSWAIFLFSWG